MTLCALRMLGQHQITGKLVDSPFILFGLDAPSAPGRRKMLTMPLGDTGYPIEIGQLYKLVLPICNLVQNAPLIVVEIRSNGA